MLRNIILAALLLLIASVVHAQEQAIPDIPFADPQIVSSFHINFSFDVRTDSSSLGVLPRLALIEKIIIVVDTQLTQIDSLRISLRAGQQPLAVLTAAEIGGDEIYQAGTMWTVLPDITTGVMEDELILHLHSPAFIDGHIRVFIIWRRLY
jgi:hypothetical protein